MGAGASVSNGYRGHFRSRIATPNDETPQFGSTTSVHVYHKLGNEPLYYIITWVPRVLDIRIYTSFDAETNLALTWDEVLVISEFEDCS